MIYPMQLRVSPHNRFPLPESRQGKLNYVWGILVRTKYVRSRSTTLKTTYLYITEEWKMRISRGSFKKKMFWLERTYGPKLMLNAYDFQYTPKFVAKVREVVSFSFIDFWRKPCRKSNIAWDLEFWNYVRTYKAAARQHNYFPAR